MQIVKSIIRSLVFNAPIIFVMGSCQTGNKTSPATQVSVIPEPVHTVVRKGNFIINRETVILVDTLTADLGKMLNNLLSPAMGYRLEIRGSGIAGMGDTGNRPPGMEAAANDASGPGPVKNSVSLQVDPSLDGIRSEGYRLMVEKDRIRIEAPAEAGIFYGMQTLRQLLPAAVFRDSVQAGVDWSVPCLEIEDYPRFRWRGMHLDVCRHFMPKDFVKKYIDLMAIHKMNVFHWHLTEDQGWRIEIEKYPGLTEISAWRDETLIGHAGEGPPKFDGIPHGGYYSREDVREIVAYAQERFVRVVPEIEMPGHSQAALAAYPELSCTGGPFEVSRMWGVHEDVYCAGNEQTFAFLENVLGEVLELFPGEFIHIGGDECAKARWEECPKCQRRIREEGLKDEDELQSYFIRRMEKFLADRGRRLIGWDEILEGGLARNATVMSWRGEEGGIEAAKAGHDVVMAPTSYTYFDYYQADPESEPLAIGGYLPIEKVYSYDPVPDVLSDQEASHILGVQAQVWTEYIPTPEHAEYMAYPRACALAEIAWTPLEKKDYERFTSSLQHHLGRLDALRVNYHK